MYDLENPPSPTALVVGPTKCGTTWIHEYLEGRGDICLPCNVKETFFFDRRYKKGLDWYLSHFRHYDSLAHKHIIEVAPTLFHHSDTLPQLIFERLGDIPIIVTVRDPIDRSLSDFRHCVRLNISPNDFTAALINKPEIVDASKYDIHLPRWQAVFSNISVLRMEDLARNPGAYVRTLNEALDLEPSDQPLPGKVNEAVTPVSRTINGWVRRTSLWLRDHRSGRIITIMKRLGLKKLLYRRGPDRKYNIDMEATRASMGRYLSDTIKWYNAQ